VLDHPALDLGTGGSPKVASAGGVTMVLRRQVAAGDVTSIVARRVSSAGRILDPAPGRVIVRSDDPERAISSVDLASNGDNYVLLYDTWGTHSGARSAGLVALSRAGAVERKVGFRLNGRSIASNGTSYLVAGEVCPDDPDQLGCPFQGQSDIYTVRVSAGLVTTPGAIAAQGPTYQAYPNVGWSAGHYLVTFVRTRVLADGGPYGAPNGEASILSSDGSVNESGSFLVSKDVLQSAATISPGPGGAFGVVYRDAYKDTIPVRFRRVSLA
jgi:hypothetical protein